MAEYIEVSKAAARRFLVYRQAFLKHKGKNGALQAVRGLECVQRDPLSVVHRNHHLVLHNRVVDYDPSFLEDLLYRDRLLFEYWCNEKSIIPLEDFPFFRYRMQNTSEFHSPYYERIKRRRVELKDDVSLVLSEIRKQGPLSSKELKVKLKRRKATQVLNLLWDFGEIMIHHVEGNRRYYDLTGRLLPTNLDTGVPRIEDYTRFMVEKHLRAYGFADIRYWRFGWLPLKVSQRKAIVEKMVRDKKLVPIRVEGVKHIFYTLEELQSLIERPDLSLKESVHFLAPLDNLLWNRRLISEIFEFDYSWEVYKIPEKRVYGYYVMPILFGSNFVGRLDPKLDRKQDKMIIKSIYLQKKLLENTTFLGEFVKAFQRFVKFHEVSKFSIEKTEPRNLRHKLLVELN